MASYSSVNGEPNSGTTIPRKLLDIYHGYYATQCMITACELEIFDSLVDRQQSAKDLSQMLSTDEQATAKLLDALVGMELLEVHQTDQEDPVYSNSPIAAVFLTKSSPVSFFLQRVEYLHGLERPLIQSLTSAVQEGTNRWKKVFNKEREKDFFDNLYNNKENLMMFLNKMSGNSKAAAPSFVTCFDLSRFKTVCDLGGCTGDIAYAACTTYPDMKITVLDLQQVIDCSSHFAPSVEECPNQHNVSFVAGDFFQPKLPTADLYVLTHIIHDWGQEKIDILLSNVFYNLPSGGGILLGESILKEDKSGPLYTLFLSLLMLVGSDRGATERTGKEYQQQLEKHGFKDVQIRLAYNHVFDAILAIKPYY